MMKAIGIAALLAGTLSIFPMAAHADPMGMRHERIERFERHGRMERMERMREHERFERARYEAGLRHAWWHRHFGWRY